MPALGRLTYVVAALSSLASLLYFVAMLADEEIRQNNLIA
jgi:hypothetical protein